MGWVGLGWFGLVRVGSAGQWVSAKAPDARPPFLCSPPAVVLAPPWSVPDALPASAPAARALALALFSERKTCSVEWRTVRRNFCSSSDLVCVVSMCGVCGMVFDVAQRASRQCGVARRGAAWRGVAWRGVTRRGVTSHAGRGLSGASQHTHVARWACCTSATSAVASRCAATAASAWWCFCWPERILRSASCCQLVVAALKSSSSWVTDASLALVT